MAADIWAVADLLRGDYKRHEYGQVILPFTVLRRLDAVMAPTREAVRARDAALTMQNKSTLLEKTAGLPFYNVSKQDFGTIASDAANVAKNLRDYVNGFSPNVREILIRFDFDNQVTKLAEAKLLYLVVGRFRDMRDLEKLSNHDMGYVFEHLIRKFAEDSNETAGEHFTPREVIELMVNLLIAPDDDTITGPKPVINILDPACGTGGMLTTADDHIKAINPGGRGVPVRAGAQPRVMVGMRVGDAAAQPARHGRARQLVQRRPVRRAEVRLHARQSAVRRGVEEGQGRGRGRGGTRVRGAVRRGAAADQRRVVPVPAAHDLEDEPGHGQGQPAGDRLQRVAAVHRGGRVG